LKVLRDGLHRSDLPIGETRGLERRDVLAEEFLERRRIDILDARSPALRYAFRLGEHHIGDSLAQPLARLGIRDGLFRQRGHLPHRVFRAEDPADGLRDVLRRREAQNFPATLFW